MSRKLTTLTASLLLAVAATPVATAQAGGPKASVTEVSATATATGFGATASATAVCPNNTKVVGGGFDAPYSVNVIPIVYESVMTGMRQWRASVQLLDPGGSSSLTLTTYAYCRSGLPNVKSSTASSPTTGEMGLGPTLAASCPDGQGAIAGGFQMPPPLGGEGVVSALLFEALPSGGGGWDSNYVTGPGGITTVSSVAYCLHRDFAPTQLAATSSPNANDFASSSVAADCPAGTSPTAGGFGQPNSGFASFFLVYESRRVGDSWRVSGVHSGNDPGVPLVSTAYCV
jgi:hypothetical protein